MLVTVSSSKCLGRTLALLSPPQDIARGTLGVGLWDKRIVRTLCANLR